MNIDKIQNYLECPICFECKPNMHFLTFCGHMVCLVCRNYLEKCPICRKKVYGSKPAYAVNKLLTDMNKNEDIMIYEIMKPLIDDVQIFQDVLNSMPVYVTEWSEKQIKIVNIMIDNLKSCKFNSSIKEEVFCIVDQLKLHTAVRNKIKFEIDKLCMFKDG